MMDILEELSKMPPRDNLTEMSKKDKKLIKAMNELTESSIPAPSQEALKRLRDAPFSDAGNAERFLAVFPNSYFYAEGKWYCWKEYYWKTIKGIELYSPLIETVRYSRFLFEIQTSSYATKEVQSAINKLICAENQPRLAATIKIISAKVYKDIKSLDANPWLLATPSNTVDLQQGIAHPPAKADFITCITNARYNPDADSHDWDNFVTEVFPDKKVRQWVQKFCGYAATGLASEHKFLILLGEGRNGKSTFVNAISEALGTYSCTIDPAVLLDSRADADGSKPTPYLAKLRGVHLVVASETKKGRTFNDALIKNITSEDRITARTLHRDPIEFWPTHTLILMSNYAPELTDVEDKGMRARLVIVPCNAVFKKLDRTLPEKLKSDNNMSAILNWLIEGAKKYRTEGLEPLPDAINQALDEYYEVNDLLNQFIDEKCQVKSDETVKATDFVNDYNEWRHENGSRPMKRKNVIASMQRKGYIYERRHKGWVFVGICLCYRGEYQ